MVTVAVRHNDEVQLNLDKSMLLAPLRARMSITTRVENDAFAAIFASRTRTRASSGSEAFCL
ncbi:MAG: hypothetical protein DMG69_05140 [Acidobacteria bacterium]|nr:MAG: hypothetical protein DMG69_05140 [Acidobacteriota bacterium]